MYFSPFCLLQPQMLSRTILCPVFYVSGFGLADSMFNLREENKQLRKAHHDIHTQLQDTQVRAAISLWSEMSDSISLHQLSFLHASGCMCSGSSSGPEGGPRPAGSEPTRPQKCSGCSSGGTAVFTLLSSGSICSSGLSLILFCIRQIFKKKKN